MNNKFHIDELLVIMYISKENNQKTVIKKSF